MATFSGNEPTDGILIGKTSHFKIWQLPKNVQNSWRQIKITAIEPMERKANYFTAYSLEERRMANSKCWQALNKYKAKKHSDEITSIIMAYYRRNRD